MCLTLLSAPVAGRNRKPYRCPYLNGIVRPTLRVIEILKGSSAVTHGYTAMHRTTDREKPLAKGKVEKLIC